MELDFDGLMDEFEEENEEDEILTMYDDDGNEQQFQLLDVIEFEGEAYMILLPVDSEDGEVEILLIEEPEDGGETNYAAVEEEELMMTLFEIFKEKNQDQFDFS